MSREAIERRVEAAIVRRLCEVCGNESIACRELGRDETGMARTLLACPVCAMLSRRRTRPVHRGALRSIAPASAVEHAREVLRAIKP